MIRSRLLQIAYWMVELGAQMMACGKLESKRIWFMHTINVVMTRMRQHHYAEPPLNGMDLFQFGIRTEDEEFWPYWMMHMVKTYEELQGAQV